MGSDLISRWADNKSLVEEAVRQDEEALERLGKGCTTHDFNDRFSKLKIDKKPIKGNTKQATPPQENLTMTTNDNANASDDWETEDDDDEDDDLETEGTNEGEQDDSKHPCPDSKFVPKQKHELSADAQRLFPMAQVAQPRFTPKLKEELVSPVSTSGSIISQVASREVTPSTEMSSIKSPKPFKSPGKSSEHSITIRAGESLVSKWATEEPEEQKPRSNSKSHQKIPKSPKNIGNNIPTSPKNFGNNRRSNDEIRFKREQERENHRKNKINSGREWDQSKQNESFYHDDQQDRSYRNRNGNGNRRGDYNENYNSSSSKLNNSSRRPKSSEGEFDRSHRQKRNESFGVTPLSNKHSTTTIPERNVKSQGSAEEQLRQEAKIELTSEEKEKLKKKYDDALSDLKTTHKSWADMDDDDNWW